ncbi:hypothetical protein OG894_10580 [Streptomyces sp. NBC_01724]|uniref:hypothetical protein n=1 Tax=unclassified Streptomyces TaxID=2593676 RepID=UPI0028C3D262|nr:MULTISPECIES: hypothetical protein [unclassified Streptomyces]WNO67977.1 hypothetical protein RPQ02_31245 [Streptomyces sp. AM2-3-1]WSC72643.1 hypothetical protein OG807_31470 [Streptomyces sp. NBC_01760]WTI90374.1 hypothetical protein OHB17_31425 [Streptomyces sp. NBC_00724]
MQTSTFPSVRALGQLLDGLGAGTARRRQLDMVRGELERALTRAALERWLDVRKDLVQRAHGTSRLWVSLWMNHDGVLDDQGNTVIRRPGCHWRRTGS